MTPDDVRDTLKMLQSGLIGAASGLVGYMVNVVHRGEAWKWPTAIVMYCVVPFFLGHVIESLWQLTADESGHVWPGMSGCIAIVGTSGGVVLATAQDGVNNLVKRLFQVLQDRLK